MWTLLPISMLLLSLDFGLEGSLGFIGMQTGLSYSALFFITWSSILKGVSCMSAQEVEMHLEQGKKLLAAGEFADALTHYHAAVDGDPKNPLTYFRRATVFLAMGKSRSAMPDLDQVLELKPDFNAARIQRGNVKLKQGLLDEAESDYREVINRDPSNADAMQHLENLEPLRINIRTAKELFNEIGDFSGAADVMTKVVEICPWNLEFRELRAECYIKLNQAHKAVGDIKSTTKLIPDNTAAFYKLSDLYYRMGEHNEALSEIRECLKLDPDHKECFALYKKLKKLVKQVDDAQAAVDEKRWPDCIMKADQILQTEPNILHYILRARGHHCHCHAEEGNIKEAFEACDKVLEISPENIEALCDKGEVYIKNEQYENAINEFTKANNIVQNHQRITDGLQRAQKLLKQSQKRDYYKILGIRRNAKKRDIIQAYRKLAIKWHPDKYEGEDKKRAEKMFIDIASAKEVLTDPEKRQKFDSGEDPLDPEQQQQGGGGPFWHQGFNPFGSGGFQFKFHY